MFSDWIPRGRRLWADRLGLMGLALFAFFIPLGTAGANIWFGFLLLAIVVAGPTLWSLLRRDPVSMLLLAFLVYVTARGAVAAAQFPDMAAAQWAEVSAWLKLLCPVIGLVMWRHLGKWWLVLILAAAGFWIDLVYEAATHWSQFVARQLDSFDRTRSSAGLYAVTALLGAVAFSAQFFTAQRSAWMTGVRVVVWLLFLASMIQAIIVSQARGTWLAALLVFPPVLLALLWPKAGRWFLEWRRGFALLLVAIVAIGFVRLNSDFLEARLAEERASISSLLSGNFENLSEGGSVSQRVQVIRYGVEKWQERPWFGWGPADSKWLIKQHPDPTIASLAHFHNGYIELLVRLGVIGALLFLGVHVVLVVRFWRAYRVGAVPWEFMIFGIGVIGLVAAWSLSGFRMTHLDWRLYWLLLIGMIQAFTLTLIRPSPEPVAAARS